MLKLYTKQQNFGPVQIQSVCRQQNEHDRRTESCFWKGRKHCWKRRKCWLPAFSPFSAMFSKGFIYRDVKSCDSVLRVNTKRQNSDWSKLKILADDKLKVAQMMRLLFNRVENIVVKGENAGYLQFLLFPQCSCFLNHFSSGSLKFGIVWQCVKPVNYCNLGKSENVLFGKELKLDIF